jgi:hypothetical protein
MQITATGYTNIYPAVKFDVRSAIVNTWSSGATQLSSDTVFGILATTDLSMIGTGTASLTSLGTVNLGMGTGGLAAVTNIGGTDIVVNGATVNISATGAVTITSPSSAVVITAPAINMNGAVAVVGSLTLGGLPVKT